MKRHRIAWLPGDGIGVEVLEAARIVLDAVGFDADYVHGDIGWEFWCGEGDAFPGAHHRAAEERRRRHVRRDHLQAGQGRRGGAGARAAGQGPASTARRSCACGSCSTSTSACAPARPIPGNPLNFKEGIDLVVFRENTEDLYAGVEFAPVPAELADVLGSVAKPFAPFQELPGDEYADLLQDQHAEGLGAHRPGGLRVRPRAAGARRSPSSTRPTWCAPPTGCSSRTAKAVAKDFPEIEMDDANIDAICMWLLKNPFNYDVLVAPNLYGDIISDLCAQMVGGLGFGCSGNIGEKLAVFEPTHGSAPKYAGQYKVNPIATILAAKMMLDWLGEPEKAARLEQRGGGRHRGRQGAHLRHGRLGDHPGDGRGDRREASTATLPRRRRAS